MKKRHFHLVLSIVFFVLIISSLADINTEIPCSETGDPPNYDCQGYFEQDFEGEFYCGSEKNNCFLKENKTEAQNRSNQPPAENKNKTENSLSVEERIKILEDDIALIQVSLEKTILTSQDVNNLKNDLASIKNSLASLKSELQQDIFKIDSDTNSLASGLAGLQRDVENTQNSIETVQEDISKGQTFTTFLIIGLVIFLIVGGIILYITRQKKQPTIHPEIIEYITTHIQEGKTFPQLKENLLKAGWEEEEIDWAYQETAKHNYQKFKNSAHPETKTKVNVAIGMESAKSTNHVKSMKPGLSQDKKKVIAIVGVSILLILAVLFILQATTGRAIFFQEAFEHSAPFICTPPHIVTEGGCCLDVNNNTVCDTVEEYEAKKAKVSAEICTDHRNCIAGESCVNSRCIVYNEKNLYNVTNCPGQSCNINNIQILTSDGEEYILHGKKGSYAAAGALAWTVRPVENYCAGQQVKIPIEIVKKDLVCYDDLNNIISCNQKHSKTKSEIVSKEIILLKKSDTSQPLTHPNEAINKKLNNYKLTLKNFNEFCFG